MRPDRQTEMHQKELDSYGHIYYYFNSDEPRDIRLLQFFVLIINLFKICKDYYFFIFNSFIVILFIALLLQIVMQF